MPEEMVFEWDAEKRLLTIIKHGIDMADAVQIFARNPMILSSSRNGEDRHLAVGPLNGVMIAVAFVMRGNATRVITARRARRNERSAYNDHDPEAGTGAKGQH